MTLSTYVEVDTRDTADNVWDGGEQVAAETVSDIDCVQPEVKTYTVDSGRKPASGGSYRQKRLRRFVIL